MNIVEFLLARIAEDEAAALDAAGVSGGFEGGDKDWCSSWLHEGIRHLVRNCDIECPEHEDDPAACGWPHRYAGTHIAHWDPTRVLAECEAKRQILRSHSQYNYCEGDEPHGREDQCPTVCALASIYANHEDYQQEWAV